MATFKHRSRKTVTLLVAGGLTVAGTGIAFAYWTSTGDGVGTATTGTSIAFDITSQAPEGDDLIPGGDAQTVDFTVANPNEGPQQLTALTVAVANADGTAWAPVGGGCSADDYVVTVPDNPAPGQVAGNGEVTGQASITMVNSLTRNQDLCKNLVVPLYFSAALPVT
jgi:hypothetical protein